MSPVEVVEPEVTVALESEDAFYEVVDDRRVESVPMGAYAIRIALKLAAEIEQFAEERDLGQAVTRTLVRLRSVPNLQRRPDAAFVSFERWPNSRRVPWDNAWDVIPDLVVEVVSPTNFAEEIPTKIREYFEASVRRAWVITPHESLVYESDSERSIRVLGLKETWEGGEILPGLQLPIAELFERTEDPQAS